MSHKLVQVGHPFLDHKWSQERPALHQWAWNSSGAKTAPAGCFVGVGNQRTLACHSSKKMKKKGVGSEIHHGSPIFFDTFLFEDPDPCSTGPRILRVVSFSCWPRADSTLSQAVVNAELKADEVGPWRLKNPVVGTVDGRHPEPPGIYKILYIVGYTTNLNWCRISSNCRYCCPTEFGSGSSSRVLVSTVRAWGGTSKWF